MAKDPAFLFYPNDYIGGTMGMTLEEKGAYIELLMMQFNRGHLTSHMIGQTVGQLWDKIRDKFIQDDDGNWYNERLEIEKQLRENYVESRNNNRSGRNQYSKPTKKKRGQTRGHTTGQTQGRMEDEDESSTEKVSSTEIEKASTEIDLTPFDESFRSHWNQWLGFKHEQFRFRYKSTRSEQTALNSLVKLSNGNQETAVEIINQSITGGWKGLFELKTNQNKTNNGKQSRAERIGESIKRQDNLLDDVVNELNRGTNTEGEQRPKNSGLLPG